MPTYYPRPLAAAWAAGLSLLLLGPAAARTVPPTAAQVAAPETPSSEAAPDGRIQMPDGQLTSHAVRIYLMAPVTGAQHPRLRLLRSHVLTQPDPAEATLFEPFLTVPGQEWFETVAGEQIRRTGTLLLFDLKRVPFGLKPMVRVMPVVTWEEAGALRTAVAGREVNLGHMLPVAALSAVIILVTLLVLARVAGSPLLLLASPGGHLSLSQTQMACWTIATGFVVLGYGFLRLEIPEIPTALVVLMGTSLATGGVGAFRDAQDAKTMGESRIKPSLSDLVRDYSSEGAAADLSMPKAQMLFWTAVLLILFIVKSGLDGVIWTVPWPLVALMGCSQTAYLAKKII